MPACLASPEPSVALQILGEECEKRYPCEVDPESVALFLDGLDETIFAGRDYLRWEELWLGIGRFTKRTRTEANQVKALVTAHGDWFVPGLEVFIGELSTKLRPFVRKSGRYGNRPGLN